MSKSISMEPQLTLEFDWLNGYLPTHLDVSKWSTTHAGANCLVVDGVKMKGSLTKWQNLYIIKVVHPSPTMLMEFCVTVWFIKRMGYK